MKLIWLSIFICALSLLIIVAVRSSNRLRWVSYAMMNLLFAAVFLYFINVTGIFGEFQIPINLVTVIVVGILGIPGLGMLMILKWLVL